MDINQWEYEYLEPEQLLEHIKKNIEKGRLADEGLQVWHSGMNQWIPTASNGVGFGDKYRREIPYITVNGFRVPAPEEEAPEEGTEYFIPEICREDFCTEIEWKGYTWDERALERGIVHLNELAAIAHGKALLGIDPSTPDPE